jgi:cytochrome c5
LRLLSTWLLIAGCALLCACTVESNEPASGDTQTLAQQGDSASWRKRYLQLGKQIYERTCASCHDDGTDGAPVIGDHDAWSERSPLWSAVLMGHAKHGYLNMPPKGGYPELTDKDVEAAGEYMLSVTFPELPRD